MKKVAFFIVIAALSMSAQAGQKIVVPKDAPKIQEALDRAQDGDTVFVCKGKYNGNIVMRDGVALIGESATETIIHGKGSGDVVKGADRSIIKNFTVENGDKGILCASVSMTVEHNFVRGNKGTGIHCLVTLPLVRNNFVYQNGWTGIFCETVRSLNTLVEHNVVAENGYSGIMLAGSSMVLVQNNVLFRNKQFGIWVNDDARKSRIIYNDFYLNRAHFNVYAQVDNTNFYQDPQYTPEGTAIGTASSAILAKPGTILHGKGKDNCDVGIVEEKALVPVIPQDRITAPEVKTEQPAQPSPAPAAPAKVEEAKAPAAQPVAVPDTAKKAAEQPKTQPSAEKKPAVPQKSIDTTKKVTPTGTVKPATPAGKK
jgi:parallel beta-helix repeat protein